MSGDNLTLTEQAAQLRQRALIESGAVRSALINEAAKLERKASAPKSNTAKLSDGTVVSVGDKVYGLQGYGDKLTRSRLITAVSPQGKISFSTFGKPDYQNAAGDYGNKTFGTFEAAKVAAIESAQRQVERDEANLEKSRVRLTAAKALTEEPAP